MYNASSFQIKEERIMSFFEVTEAIKKIRKIKYLVKGDHPTLARPDKVFVGQAARRAAEEYKKELLRDGYENVEIEEIQEEE
jgi:hypothetical protein